MVSNFIYPFDFYFQSPWKERGCSQKHFQNVRSFSKHQIWCPRPLDLTVWQKNWGAAKAWSAITYILSISTFSLDGKKGDAAKSILKMCVHFQNIKFGVQAPLVEIELTVWQKNWGGAKAWSAISYIPLIPTFSLQPTAF